MRRQPSVRLTVLCAGAGLALACSKLDQNEKKSSPTPTPAPSATAGGKDVKPTPKSANVTPTPQATATPSTAADTPPSTQWFVRANETGQSFFPLFSSAQRVEDVPYNCADTAYAGGKMLFNLREAAFCTPGGHSLLSYDYEEPNSSRQTMRSLALVAPWQMGLKTPANSAAPWILVDLLKEIEENGSVSLSLLLKGSHEIAGVPTTGTGGSTSVYDYPYIATLDSDGSIPDDSDASVFADKLVSNDVGGVGGLQVKLSAKGPVGTLEFKVGTKTLTLEPQWKTLEEILPAESFKLPGNGTLVQAGVPTLTTPPMGTTESDLECPAMAFAPTIWDLSGMRKFIYCYAVDSLNNSFANDVPTQREHVSLRYDVPMQAGQSAYSVSLTVDQCDTFKNKFVCSVEAKVPGTSKQESLASDETFSYRGLTVTIQETGGVLASIKVRKPGDTTDTTFTARQFPL